MSQNSSPRPKRDNALLIICGYLFSGLLIWGSIGWFLDKWLDTQHFAWMGLTLGAGASLYLIWLRFGRK
jgi:F0F1-type ATP synthase assembly protein I